jgi:uncharacterized integral membrane protein
MDGPWIITRALRLDLSGVGLLLVGILLTMLFFQYASYDRDFKYVSKRARFPIITLSLAIAMCGFWMVLLSFFERVWPAR